MCDFPYLYNNKTDNCSTTFAEAIGFNYDIYWSLFLSLSIITFLITFIQNIRLYIAIEQRVLDKNAKIIYFDKVIMGIIMTMSSLLLIESVDPQGFRGVLPLIVESLASNLCTFMGYVIVYYYMYMVISCIREYDTIYVKIAWIFLGIITLSATIALTVIQVYVDWGFSRGMKLAVFAAIILVTSVVLITILINRYLLLTHLEKQDIHSEQKNRMLKCLISYSVFVAVIFSYQVYSSNYAFNHLKEKPQQEITIDQIAFPLLQWISICLILILKWNVAGVEVDVNKFIFNKTNCLSCSKKALEELDDGIINFNQNNPVLNTFNTFPQNVSPSTTSQNSPNSTDSYLGDYA